MEKIKKIGFISFLFVTLLSFSGCFNFFGEEESQEGLPDATSSTYQQNDFSLTVPSSWEVIDKNDFTSDVPDETVVVFRNNVKNETFTANVVVVQRTLQSSVDSLEYANLVNNRQKSGLIDYRELSKEQITLGIGEGEESTYFTKFEARKATNEPLIRYQQLYGVSGSLAYIVTGASSEQENDSTVQTIETIVRSFRLK